MWKTFLSALNVFQQAHLVSKMIPQKLRWLQQQLKWNLL